MTILGKSLFASTIFLAFVGAAGCTAETSTDGDTDGDTVDTVSEELTVVPHGFLRNDAGHCLATDVPFGGNEAFTGIGNCANPDDGGDKLVSIVSVSFVMNVTGAWGNVFATTVSGVQIQFRDLYNRTQAPSPKLATKCLLSTTGRLGACTPSPANTFKRVGRTFRPMSASRGTVVTLPYALGEGALVSNWYPLAGVRVTHPSGSWTFVPK